MAELLKNQYFQPDFINQLSDQITGVYKPFNKEKFQALIYDGSWSERPLKEMMSHISVSLNKSLPTDYLNALDILKKICVHFKGFDGMIFPDFVGQFGLNYWDESLEALELFTQYSSGEFAIRHFILKDTAAAMTKMLEWSRHENYHVRRLASEGCRPRLPWAMALPEFKNDPSLILPILENLKADESEYVRKSVANNLNDLTKDNIEVTLQLAKKWLVNAPKETQWIVKHGFRSLVKAGHQEALSLLGFKSKNINLKELKIRNTNLKLGETLAFDFKLVNDGKSKAILVVDYILHFVKANGKTAPKVFKIADIILRPGESRELSKKQVIKEITTRKYYSGKTILEIQVNGKLIGKEAFMLLVP